MNCDVCHKRPADCYCTEYELAAKKIENLQAEVVRYTGFLAAAEMRAWSLGDDLKQLRAKVSSLFAEIEHGDKEHRKWLWAKIDEHFRGFL